MKKIQLFICLIVSAFAAVAQSPSAPSDTLRKDALNVFMETTDYIRREIAYINYVRDIKDAGVYILQSYQRAGSGGWEYTYFFVGQREFAGISDTLSFVTMPDETMEGIRQKEVNTLKMGLMRYVARTPLSKFISINFTEPLSETVSTDNWNSWVFRTSVNGYLNGQKSYKSSYLSGNISANRTTEALKLNISARYFYSLDKFDIDGSTLKSDNRSKSLTILLVKSLSNHWSSGGYLSMGSSSYNNEQSFYSLMPALEYDVYPYSESTRRQLRFLYKAGYYNVSYLDTTIYNHTKDNLWQHNLTVAYGVIQKWGTIDVSLIYENYLHDFSKNSLTFDGYINLRIAKGLSINCYGSIAVIHNQLGLVKGGATREEVILQRKELETQYQYYTSFGISYTFGSIYNNVVNPRFGQ